MKQLIIILRAVSPILLSLLVLSCQSNSKTIYISIDDKNPLLKFSLNEIELALSRNVVLSRIVSTESADIVFSIDPQNDQIESEGFKISKKDNIISVLASDTAGAMYGGLELAEQIRLYGIDNIKETSQNPYMKMRGTKFNIPLDVRTPSYSDASDVAQVNIEEMWNFEFWTEYIDNIAKYRYNFISFWSLHPFPSLVKVPDYPDIALNDVHKSTNDWSEYYSLGARDYDSPEIVNNYEVIKTITIEEKIEFWKKLMRYAKNRNIDIYFVTWNIFVNGTNGKYGITHDVNNETTKDYFIKSIAEMFRTYKDLAGIGLTTGENMKGVSFEEKENWAYDTYAKGILEVAKEFPDRQFTLIHRQHQADPVYIEQKFEPVIKQKNVKFIYSFKYAKAHVFSATTQPYHEEFVKNIGSLKTIWTLRNDDAYYFRWGSPEFVREFIKNIPYDVSEGMYYGSDQWIWGREFTSKNSKQPRQLEIVKHWYHWMMWGRLSYNPQMTNEKFIGMLETQFPNTDAEKLFTAWHEASMVYPVTTGFHWGRVDFLWYIEGCRSRPKNAKNETGFHDVNAFIFYPVHPKAGNQSIPEYTKMVVSNKSTKLNTPLDVAEKLHSHSNNALGILSTLKSTEQQELLVTLNDIKTISYMGKYYAHKIAGSTYLALYRETKNKNYQKKSIDELTEAVVYWEKYMNSAMEQNINPIWTNRVGIVDWVKTFELVKKDIEIVRGGMK